MSARSSAIHDIKEELKKQDKCFLAFHSELNHPIRDIINNYLKKQSEL